MTNVINSFKHRSEETMNNAELFAYANALQERCKQLFDRALNFETFSLEGAAELERASDDFTHIKARVSITEIESGDPVKEVWDLNAALFQAAAGPLVQVGIWYKKVAMERSRGVSNPSSAESLRNAVKTLDLPEAADLKTCLTEFIEDPNAVSPITGAVQKSGKASRKNTALRNFRPVQRASHKNTTPPPATATEAAPIKPEEKHGFFERLFLFFLSFFCKNPLRNKELSHDPV